MKSPRQTKLLAASGLLIALLLLLGLLNNRRVDKLDPESVSNPAPTPKSPKQIPDLSIHIVSDQMTSTGRVVAVEQSGERRYLVLPKTREFSDDMIRQMAEAILQKPEAPTTQPPGRLNDRLLFYGQVVDDETNGVPGAEIKGTALVMNGGRSGGDTPVSTLAGAEGRFSFDIPNGQSLMLRASKEPDYIPSEFQSFQYGTRGQAPIHQPDSTRPVPFMVTKKQKREPLLEINRWWGAPNTGEPVRIDLSTGNKVPAGGDIVVSIECPEPFKAGNKIPWKLVIDAPGGGLLAVSTERLEYMLSAPVGGYGPIVVEHAKDADDWSPQFDGYLYLKARNGGIYAKLLFHMHTHWDERGVPFGFKAFVNTNGSRNLQGLP